MRVWQHSTEAKQQIGFTVKSVYIATALCGEMRRTEVKFGNVGGVWRTFDNGFVPERKNPPEAGSLKMVPEPGL
ncbi:hypothetical protein, partial [Pantoea vagans]